MTRLLNPLAEDHEDDDGRLGALLPTAPQFVGRPVRWLDGEGVGATAIETPSPVALMTAHMREKYGRIPQFSQSGAPNIRWLGQTRAAAGALGALPYPVNIYFPELAPDWDQMPQDMKNQVTAEAQKQDQIYLNSVAAMKKEPGACDATVPGKLAGQLKEYLVEAGGDPSVMGSADNVFGSAEMGEWIRVFGKAPTKTDAAAAVGTVWFGKRPISLATICGTAIKLPTVAPPAPAPGPAPGPVVEPPPVTSVAPKKSSKGWLLLAAGAAGALFLALKAPAVPPREADRDR